MRLILLLTLLVAAACEPSVNHVNVPCGAIHPVDAKYGQDVCPRGK